ncbi:MAG: hypothetical protein FWD25_02040 [Clostridia bacterium]|nr:hypothetical protein [Clostridia bacterium]
MMESLEYLEHEGLYPTLIVYNQTYQLDNHTDAHILMFSRNMDTRTDPASVLKNSTYRPTSSSPIEAVRATMYEGAETNFDYVRYWMGFRVYVRPLLSVMNYTQIRHFIMWVFFLLFAVALVMIHEKTKSRMISMIFAASVVMLNPIIVSSSLQFVICFLIAFVGMIGISLCKNKWLSHPMYFVILGAATQYFDFYTAPLLTFGLPAITMVLCIQYGEKPYKTSAVYKVVAKCLVAWLLSYALMWFAKLALTTLFTPVNGFENGFSSMIRRMGIIKIEQLSRHYDVKRALKACFHNLLPFVENRVVLIFAALALVTWAVAFIRCKSRKESFKQAFVYVIIAVLPVMWICVAAQPSSIHAWFQYRCLGVFVLGMGCFLWQSVTMEKWKPACLDGHGED